MYFSQNERRRSSRSYSFQFAASLAIALGLSALAAHPSLANPDVDRVARASVISQSDHVLDKARLLGRQAGETQMQIAFGLPLRNQAGLHDLIRRLYDRNDPLYGKYLTPTQFTQRFAPSQSDFDAVVAYAKSLGLTVKQETSPSTLVVATGSTSTVEAAFGVNINRYLASDGRIVYANDAGPQVPAAIASRISGIIGLNNLSRRHHTHHQAADPAAGIFGNSVPSINHGPSGGLAPIDIQKAYSLDTVALKGEGQTVALYELDGYNPTDVQTYLGQFNLGTGTNIQNIYVDLFSGTPQTVDGTIEVVLDIDMIMALAPNLKNLLVYEGDPNNDSAVLDTYQQIATDDAAQVVSTSWGTAEQPLNAGFKLFAETEDGIFLQMATQGQTIFDASGDGGAYDNGSTISIDDPAGHPTVTAVGGTTLTTNADGSYNSEIVWKGTLAEAAANGGGSGGGVSTIWSIPTWQTPVTTLASNTFRNVPDVALNADSATGYDIYAPEASNLPGFTGWIPVGGTSAAAPLWAAFTALINEERTFNGLSAVGFFNPTIYAQALAVTPANNYANLFHDVITGDNLFYKAGVGYDNATGWGSFKGAAWITAVGGSSGQIGTVTGTVTDTVGTPVTTATVTAYLKSNGVKAASAAVDSTGTYSLTLTAGVSYRFTATAGNYEGQVVGLTLPSTAATTTTQNFTLVPSHLYSTGLQMISAPEDFTNVAGIGSLLTPESATTTYSPLMYAWAPYQSEYVGTPSSPADTLRIGQGYWVRFPDQMYLALQGMSTPTTSVFHLTLQAGWNMIGDPFPVAVSIPAIQVETLSSTGATTIGSSALVSLPLYSYDQTSNAYVTHTTDSILPYAGYWIYAKQACQLLITPPGGIIPNPPGSPLTKPAAPSYGFKLRPR